MEIVQIIHAIKKSITLQPVSFTSHRELCRKKRHRRVCHFLMEAVQHVSVTWKHISKLPVDNGGKEHSYHIQIQLNGMNFMVFAIPK